MHKLYKRAYKSQGARKPRGSWLLLFTEWLFIGLIIFFRKNDDIESYHFIGGYNSLYLLIKNEEF